MKLKVGAHSLQNIAERSAEALASLGRSGGRNKSPSQLVARAYLKVLKSLVELQVDLEAAGVPWEESIRTPPTTLALSHTVPLAHFMVTHDPVLPVLTPPAPVFTHFLVPWRRVRWIIFVYLPSLLVLAAVLVGFLVLSHIASHPERLSDALIDMMIAGPRFGFSVISRMGESAFNRIFGFRRYVVPTANPQIAQNFLVPAAAATDGTTVAILIILVLSLGWYLSALPSHPATRQI